MTAHVLIVGTSARAAADSAARGGFEVTAIDGFGDQDQHPAVTVVPLTGGFRPRAAIRAAVSIPSDAGAYVSNIDNHPSLVSSLSVGRALWGNLPQVLRRCRDPRLLEMVLRRRDLPSPAVDAPAASQRQLLKPLASGGGHRIRFWRPGANIPRRQYLQEFIDGIPGSVVFLAAAGGVSVLGVTRQLVGMPAFGVGRFRYCGNLLFNPDRQILAQARAAAAAVAEDFGLVGLNGLDFVLRDADVYPIEVNPRWTAAMELVERAHGLSLFALHADACTAQILPRVELANQPLNGVFGKAVVFAKRSSVVRDPGIWLTGEIRDVPHPGDRIDAGQPVCTVFASAESQAACVDALERRAGGIYAQLDAWAVEAA